jgi:dsDNA-specific endonuclease/ATPase MutS2
MKKDKIIIVHGNGTGILKKITQETLRINKLVEEYKIDNFNTGMTVVTLRKH